MLRSVNCGTAENPSGAICCELLGRLLSVRSTELVTWGSNTPCSARCVRWLISASMMRT